MIWNLFQPKWFYDQSVIKWSVWFYDHSVIKWPHFQFPMEMGMLGTISSGNSSGQGSRAFLAPLSLGVWTKEDQAGLRSQFTQNPVIPSQPFHYPLLELTPKTPAKCNFPSFPALSSALTAALGQEHLSFCRAESRTANQQRARAALSGVWAFQTFSFFRTSSHIADVFNTHYYRDLHSWSKSSKKEKNTQKESLIQNWVESSSSPQLLYHILGFRGILFLDQLLLWCFSKKKPNNTKCSHSTLESESCVGFSLQSRRKK